MNFRERERERSEGRERETLICSTYLGILRLLLVRDRSGDQTHSLGVSGQHSN